jgi:hypothetical protein
MAPPQAMSVSARACEKPLTACAKVHGFVRKMASNAYL